MTSKLGKAGYYILLQGKESALTDKHGNILFFKEKDEAEKYIKAKKIPGIVK